MEKNPITEPVPTRFLQQEIRGLSKENLLYIQGDNQVFIAKASQIPSILTEIGRLRECTFREVGEGTGNPVDLDKYDEYYFHLFVWNSKDQKVVGAYRIGQVDKILDALGAKGLYSSQFYRYSHAFLRSHRMALELGRSFISREYQKKHHSLFCLWKGICCFIAKNPHYRYLLGAVSVSRDYEDLSRALITNILQDRKEPLQSKMPPKNTMRRELKAFCKLYHNFTMDDLSLLVKSIEKDEKDIPELLKQYVKLGGRIYSFCEDEKFNNSIDGLIVVDLPNSQLKSVQLFMGDDAEKYLAYHSNEVV